VTWEGKEDGETWGKDKSNKGSRGRECELANSGRRNRGSTTAQDPWEATRFFQEGKGHSSEQRGGRKKLCGITPKQKREEKRVRIKGTLLALGKGVKLVRL